MRKYEPSHEELKWAEHFLPVIKKLEARTPASYRFWLTGSLLLSIVSRETLWTTSPLYVLEGKPAPGRADGTGDHGHGRGIWQIDDRWHKDFLKKSDWKDPYKAGCYIMDAVLIPAYLYLAKKFPGQPIHTLKSGAVAAYNCGAGNVYKCWQSGTHEDTRTAGGNYSRDVLNRQNTFWSDWYESMKENPNGNQP